MQTGSKTNSESKKSLLDDGSRNSSSLSISKLREALLRIAHLITCNSDHNNDDICDLCASDLNLRSSKRSYIRVMVVRQACKIA